jgi:hypothetical protein
LYEFENFDSAVRQSYHHDGAGNAEEEASCFYWIVACPYAFVFKTLFLFKPALDRAQRQHVLYIFIILPGEFGVGDKRVKLFHGVVVAGGEDDEVLVVEVVEDDLACVRKQIPSSLILSSI